MAVRRLKKLAECPGFVDSKQLKQIWVVLVKSRVPEFVEPKQLDTSRIRFIFPSPNLEFVAAADLCFALLHCGYGLSSRFCLSPVYSWLKSVPPGTLPKQHQAKKNAKAVLVVLSLTDGCTSAEGLLCCSYESSSSLCVSNLNRGFMSTASVAGPSTTAVPGYSFGNIAFWHIEAVSEVPPGCFQCSVDLVQVSPLHPHW